MNIIIVILSFIIIMLYGLKIMGRIDFFIENNINKKEAEYGVLIYGDEEYTNHLAKMLSCKSIRYKIIDYSLIDKKEDYSGYKYIITLSKEDLNNLMVCRISSRYYYLHNMYSICNDEKNEIIYDEYGIHVMRIDEICKNTFISSIKEKLRNE